MGFLLHRVFLDIRYEIAGNTRGRNCRIHVFTFFLEGSASSASPFLFFSAFPFVFFLSSFSRSSISFISFSISMIRVLHLG